MAWINCTYSYADFLRLDKVIRLGLDFTLAQAVHISESASRCGFISLPDLLYRFLFVCKHLYFLSPTQGGWVSKGKRDWDKCRENLYDRE